MTTIWNGNDSIDFRRELFYQLSALPAAARTRFVEWAARQFNAQMRGPRAVQDGDVITKVRDTTGGEVQEAYSDISLLVFQGMNIDVLMRGLEVFARSIRK
jgi:hypothetical protein